MVPVNSEQIIASLLGSDPEKAFQQIYELYARRLLGVAYRYVGDREVAKDLFQEAICKVYKARNSFKYQREGSLMAWLKRIMINECINHLKSFHVRMVDRYDEGQQRAEEVPQDEEVGWLAQLDNDLLMEMIAGLPDGYRLVLNMYVIEGFSHKEIAARLGIKERSSSSQYHRAKLELKRRIEQWIKEQE